MLKSQQSYFGFLVVGREGEIGGVLVLLTGRGLVQQRLFKHLYKWLCSSIFYLLSNWTHEIHVITVTEHQEGLFAPDAEQ